MAKHEEHPRQVTDGAKGGKSRAALMTPEERSEAARRAAEARWGRGGTPISEYAGELTIGDLALDCAVLPDGRRIITQKSIMTALGRSASQGRRARNDNRPPFLEANNLLPYIGPDLTEQMNKVEYRIKGESGTRYGYPAAIIPDVCEVYLDARRDGVLAKAQIPAAEAAEILVRGLARVGITALVDEATGYQVKRAEDELRRLLEQYVSEAHRPWIKKFPQQFFQEVYRLHGWEFLPDNHKHPQYVGKFINTTVYEQMPPGILEGLRQVNPTNAAGHRARRHHQHIREGQPLDHLVDQIKAVITIMEISDDKADFWRLFGKKFHGQAALPLELDD